jgi:RNA polymerase sigma-70 factor (ECF subfamily)
LTEKEKHIELEFIQKSKENKQFFGFLYEKYYEQIFVFIFKKLQDEDITGEVCSLTFLKAMSNLEKYEDRGFPFSSWLYRIASNEVNQYFRKNKKNITVEVNEHSLTEIVEELDIENKEEQLALVLKAIEELPLEKSQLIELRYFEELSFKEIASIFAITDANAKMRIYRIIETIKKSIKRG